MAFYITKASGTKELFDIHKFRRSLTKSGASPELIKHLVHELEKMPELRSTRDIYDFALQHLKQNPHLAGRYNIKHALFELGPAGLPFEQFVGALFKAQGYTVQEQQIIQGLCVPHEVDVVAAKDNERCMIECKFHIRQGLVCDVKIPLYVKARFDDVAHAWRKEADQNSTHYLAWLVTNTRFTSQAIAYAQCVGLKLLGWAYPAHGNIADLIDQFKMYPITALTSLSHQQKRDFIKHGFVLCRDASQQIELLKNYGFSPHQIDALIKEADAVCNLEKIN